MWRAHITAHDLTSFLHWHALRSPCTQGGTPDREPDSSHCLQVRADLAASFQVTAIRHLEERTARAVAWAQDSCPGIRRARSPSNTARVASASEVMVLLLRLRGDQPLCHNASRPKALSCPYLRCCACRLLIAPPRTCKP